MEKLVPILNLLSYFSIFISILLSQKAYAQNLIYQNFFEDFSNLNDGFGVLGNTNCCGQNCGIYQIFGGQDYFNWDTYIYKTFELPPHYKVKIQFYFWRIDYWNGETFFVLIDNIIVFSQPFYTSQSNSNLCGQPGFSDTNHFISQTIYHQSSTAIVIIKLQFFIYECPNGCQYCDEFKCLKQFELIYSTFNSKYFQVLNQDESWLNEDNLIQQNVNVINCLDYYYYKSDGNDLIKTFNLPIHISISLQLKVFLVNSVHQVILIFIDEVEVFRIQEDQYIQTRGDICKNITIFPFDLLDYKHSSQTIKITVKAFFFKSYYENCQGDPECLSLQAIGIRDFKLFIQRSSEITQKDITYKQCEIGWKYHVQLNQCISICGDSIVTYLEECDDGNNIPYDGCHNCKFSCSQFCMDCFFGKCFQCESQFLLDRNYKCIIAQQICQPECIVCSNSLCYLCQDGQILINNQCQQVSGGQLLEMYSNSLQQSHFNHAAQLQDSIQNLDNVNLIQYKQDCQLECLSCLTGQCYLCFEGWVLTNNNCEQVCGDKLLAILSNEQCDDGNQINGDGCFNCQIECKQNCVICNDLTTCLVCQDNFELIKDNCIPKCGDGFVVDGLEECDDGNDISFDGCFDCQFQCENDCQICDQGKCKKFYEKDTQTQQDDEKDIDINKNQRDKCLSSCDYCENEVCEQQCQQQIIQREGECLKCGDWQKEEQEECDDGNNLNNDGCSEYCLIETGWNCTQFTYKQNQCFKLTLMQLTYLSQNFDVQQIKLSFTNEVRLDQSSSSFINSSSFIITGLRNESYSIQVYPASNLTELLINENRKVEYIIKIIIHEKIDTNPKLAIDVFDILWDINSMPIYPQTYQLELKIPQVMSSQELEKAVTTKQIGLSAQIGLSSAGAILFISGQIIQSQDILDILQYQSYLKFVNVNCSENLIIFFDSSNFVTLISTFKFDFNNQLFGETVINSIGKFQEYQINADFLTNTQIQILQLVVIFGLFMLSQLYKRYVLLESLIKNCMDKSKSNLLFYLLLKLLTLHKSILNLSNVDFSVKLIELFHLNSQDIIFKVLLHLFSSSSNSIRLQISNYICVSILISVFFIIIRPIRNINNKLTKQTILDQQYESLIMMKKLLFFTFLTGMQNNPLLQCLMLPFPFIFYLAIIKHYKFIKSKFDLVFVFWVEVPVIFVILINCFNCQDFSHHFTYNSKITIGFLQAGLLIFGTLGPLVKQLIQTSWKIKSYFQNRNKKNPQQKTIFTIINY